MAGVIKLPTIHNREVSCSEEEQLFAVSCSGHFLWVW